MVIDSSAIIALLLAEPETSKFVSAIAAAPRRLLGAPSYLEAAIVMISRSGTDAQEKLDKLLRELAVEVVPFSGEQARLAIGAFRTYGKGTGHIAGLNFGDCFTYALAKATDEPVLFKGNDFLHTDLKVAVSP
jgi:ribonuclease VapC